jgi:hypothetical protein
MSDKKSSVLPFNPLDKQHLGESVGQAMLRQLVFPLEELEAFQGAGIYAIYYTGNFQGYEVISEANQHNSFRAPIYVGKAVPSGARKGGDLEAKPGKVLFNRIKQHLKSVRQAENLDSNDFYCRFLIVDDIWIPLGESLLIAKFNPIWNKLIDGFGNHDPGKGRHKGMRPRWDELHPGRPWAQKCEPREESKDQILGEIRDYLRNNPPPADDRMITS